MAKQTSSGHMVEFDEEHFVNEEDTFTLSHEEECFLDSFLRMLDLVFLLCCLGGSSIFLGLEIGAEKIKSTHM